MPQIGFENAFDDAGHVLRDNIAIKLAAERRVRAEAAADENVIALDRIVVFIRLHFAGEQADLRNKMLRAGMVAAGQMNIDRRVEERNARLAPRRDLLGMALGVGGGKFAAGVAGARDETGTDRIGLNSKPERSDPRLCLSKIFRR